MKHFLTLISCFVVIGTSSNALAFSEIAVTAGALTTESSTDNDSVDTSGGTGFFAGILGFMEMQDSFYLRSGAVVSNRKTTIESGNSEGDYDLMYIEAPITGMYMFNEMVGAFGGIRLGLNIGDDCSGDAGICDADTDFSSIIYAAELGGHFRFTPNFGIEAAYNIGFSDLAEMDTATDKEIAWDGGLVVNAFFLF